MDIVVTVKQVADPNIPPSHLQLDPEGKRVVSPFGIPPVMNGYDANALEEALRLKEKHGGRVSAIGIGDDKSRDSLKLAMAMGADKVVLLNDPDWLNADSAGTGRVLAAAVKKIGNFDLIMCGRQASDTDGGQVLHWIAAAFGLPVVTPVAKIEAVEGQVLTVHRLTDEGYQRVRVELPALLGMSSEANEPRYPPMRGTMAAARAMLPKWKASDLGIGPLAAKVELRKLEIQVSTTKAELIKGDTAAAQGAALANKLRELGLI